MAAAGRFEVGPAPVLRGETAGEGVPIVLCHGITATRRYVVHGSRMLERAGFRVEGVERGGGVQRGVRRDQWVGAVLVGEVPVV